MLSTNKKSDLFINNVNGRLLYDNNSTLHTVLPTGKYQHLYIISDEEIREGDWFLVSETELHKCLSISTDGKIFSTELDLNDPFGEDYYYFIKEEAKKIIATTDKSLTISEIIYPEELIHVLPTVPDDFVVKFITKYNINNPITEIMVEYEGKSGRILSYGRGIISPDIHLKVDNNNCITIYPIKESWAREEVEKIIHDICGTMYKENTLYPPQSVQKWIEQNL